jgi:hypothetical protein
MFANISTSNANLGRREKMKNKHIARVLYGRTKRQESFTVNDLREPPKGGKPLSDLFTHPNQIGRFFGDLSKEGFAYKIGQDLRLQNRTRPSHPPRCQEAVGVEVDLDAEGPYRVRCLRGSLMFEKIMRYLELGYARKWWIDLFSRGIISADEMLRKLDEVDEKYRMSKSKCY